MKKNITLVCLFLNFYFLILNLVNAQPPPPPPPNYYILNLRAQINSSPSADTDNVFIYSYYYASDGFDKYDKIKNMSNDSDYCNIYAVIPGYNLSKDDISDLTSSKKIKLGFDVKKSANCTFKAFHIINFNNGTKIYLVDSTSSGVNKQDLAINPVYSFNFTTSETDNTTRFYLLIDVPNNLCSGFSVSAKSFKTTCDTCSNGYAWAQVTGGKPPYSYSWNTNPVQTKDTANRLKHGTYQICVTDINGCKACSGITVQSGQPPVPKDSIVVSNISLPFVGDTSLPVYVAILNKVAAFALYLRGFDTISLTFINLKNINPLLGDSGTLTSNFNKKASGGPDLELSWSKTNPNKGLNFDNTKLFDIEIKYLTKNQDIVSFISAKCSVSDSAGNNIPVIYFWKTKRSKCIGFSVNAKGSDASCNTCSNGYAWALVTGGAPPYSYIWNTTPVQHTDIANGLKPGTYKVCVTDTNGCNVCNSVVINTKPEKYSLISLRTHIIGTVPEDTDVTAIFFMAGATDGYDACCDGLTNIISDTNYCSIYSVILGYDLSIQGLPPLTHNRKVQLGFWVNKSGKATIKATQLSDFIYGTKIYLVDSTSSGVNIQDLTINPSYTFSFTFSETDNNTRFYLIIDLPTSLCNGFSVVADGINTTCSTCADGSAWAQVTGGTPPYSYSWNTKPVQNTVTADGLTPGTYRICVTDINGCIVCDSVVINSGECSAQFDFYPTGISHVYNAVNMATGVEPLKYLWNWGDGTFDTIPYPKHSYDTLGFYKICLTITDFVGCQSTFCNSYYLQKSNNPVIQVNVYPYTWLSVNQLSTINYQPLTIYPNPASDFITINISPNLKSHISYLISIKNLQGQEVFKQSTVYSPQSTINISGLRNGIYFISLQIEKLNYNSKIVIQK